MNRITLFKSSTYTRRQFDPESGTYYYRARTYSPELGRFLTKDPIGFAGGDANLYRYVGNDPVSNTDPSGRVIVDMTNNKRGSTGLSPTAQKAYNDLDSNPNVIVILTDEGTASGGYGHTKVSGPNAYTLVLNPNQSDVTMNSTIGHELTHVQDLLIKENYNQAQGDDYLDFYKKYLEPRAQAKEAEIAIEGFSSYQGDACPRP